MKMEYKIRMNKGIPNVTVSDGKTLTVTDEKGNYQLIIDTERRERDIVFVTVPSGYSAQKTKIKHHSSISSLTTSKPMKHENKISDYYIRQKQ